METWSITNLQHLSTTKNLLMNQRSDLMSITSIKYIISILSGSHHVTFFANALRPCANVENCNNFWYSFYWWILQAGVFLYISQIEIRLQNFRDLTNNFTKPNSITKFYCKFWVLFLDMNYTSICIYTIHTALDWRYSFFKTRDTLVT